MTGFRPVFLAAGLALTTLSFAQIKLPGGSKIDIKLPSLSDLMKGEAPLTTTMDDVSHYGFPEFDGWNPIQTTTVTASHRTPEGAWKLQPGSYTAEMHTFCLRGYTYGPTAGMGYLSGPWKGGKAIFINDLLHRYSKDSTVDQRDMQLLLWAVLARVNPKDMKGGAQRALLKLMGDDGPRLMAEGALDHFADKAANDLFSKADNAMKPILQFENQMRGMFAQANSTFDEFERLAVLEAPEDLKTDIPRGRWLLHPKGYWYRYAPKGYSRTSMDIVVPRKPVVVKDDLKRVTSLTVGDDFKVEITYNDEVAPFKVPGETDLTAYAVKHIKSVAPHAKTAGQTVTFDKAVDAWVFVGVPSKKNSQLTTLRLNFHRPTFAPMQNGFGRWRERYEGAQEWRDRIETYEEFVARQQRIERGERPDEDVFNTDHIKDLIDSLFGGTDDRLEQIGDTHGRLAEWLSHATEQIGGMGDDGSTTVDPSDVVILPGNTGSQRLGASSLTF